MKNEIMKAVNSLCEYESKTPIAVYLRGSRLKKMNTADSDYDLVVIVDSSGLELVSDKTYSMTKKVNDCDIQLWSIKTLYQHIVKNDINTFEILAHKPLIFNDKYLSNQQLRYFDLINQLNQNSILSAMNIVALPKFYYASCSILTQQLKRERVNFKEASIALSFANYAYNILHKKAVDAETRYSNAARKMHNGELNDKQMLNDLLHEFKSWNDDVVKHINSNDYKESKRFFKDSINCIFDGCFDQQISLQTCHNEMLYKTYDLEFTDNFDDSLQYYYVESTNTFETTDTLTCYQTASYAQDDKLVSDEEAGNILKINNCKLLQNGIITSPKASDLIATIVTISTLASVRLKQKVKLS